MSRSLSGADQISRDSGRLSLSESFYGAMPTHDRTSKSRTSASLKNALVEPLLGDDAVISSSLQLQGTVGSFAEPNDSKSGILNSLDDEELEQGCFSKAVYGLFGLKWSPKVFDKELPLGPQMYKFHNIGLYCHYAAIGLIGGIGGLCQNFCFYFYNGPNNVCANSGTFVFMAWGFKIFYAMLTDSYRPFGTRRKYFMSWGWMGALLCTAVLAVIGDTCSVNTWVGLSVATQAFAMLSDVPADGYSVELGQLESEEERGMILSTGQYIRFIMSMLAGVIQATLVNGKATNDPDCVVSFETCWSWGLTVGEYYMLLFAILLPMVLPIMFLREPSAKNIPQHSFSEHRHELWETLKNPTTMFLLIFVTGNGCFSIMSPTTFTYVQYKVLGLTNFQAGVQTIVSFLALVVGIKVFQKYFIQTNWRFTLYLSISLVACLGLMWIMVYHNTFGLLNPWFTIFITVNQSLAQGLSQVLFSMAVIELAKKGQEAITYELVISIANSASSLSTILATQLLDPLKSVVCKGASCTADQVNVTNTASYFASDGPGRFTEYSLVILGINLVSLLFFTNFLPRQKYECHEWKAKGERGEMWLGATATGIFSSTLACTVIGYYLMSTAAFLIPSLSCLAIFGGEGCTA